MSKRSFVYNLRTVLRNRTEVENYRMLLHISSFTIIYMNKYYNKTFLIDFSSINTYKKVLKINYIIIFTEKYLLRWNYILAKTLNVTNIIRPTSNNSYDENNSSSHNSIKN